MQWRSADTMKHRLLLEPIARVNSSNYVLIGLQIIGRFLNFKHKLIVHPEKLIACLMWNNFEVMHFDLERTGCSSAIQLNGGNECITNSMCTHEDDPSR